MFPLLIVASCLLALAKSAPQTFGVPKLDGRIVGGQPTSIEDYPYQASLFISDEYTCAAVIISEEYVVTVASCTYGTAAPYWSVRVGSTYYEAGGEVIGVAEVYEHPEFNRFTSDYDIGILKLDSSLTFGSAVAPIALPELNQPTIAGQLATVTGWGSLSEISPSLADQLYVVQVPLVSLESCAASYINTTGDVTDNMVCAGYPEGGKDACYGDSGAPLVIDDVLIGLVSWGSGCARPNRPGVYASVPALRDYITEVTGL